MLNLNLSQVDALVEYALSCVRVLFCVMLFVLCRFLYSLLQHLYQKVKEYISSAGEGLIEVVSRKILLVGYACYNALM